MKTGKSLSALAAEIERQQNTKRDLIASTESMQVAGGEQGISMKVGDNEFGINGLAHDQIGAHTSIPSKYYDKMLAEAPDLLATNVNRWFTKYPAPRLVRTLDGNTRAFLSNTYRPLENADLAEAVLPILLDMRLDIMSCEITERRLYIKAVDERLKADVPYGYKMGDGTHKFFDTCSPAIIISNSEVGYGQLSIDSGIFTKVCTNMAMIAAGGMKRRHVGARNALTDGEVVRELLSDATKAATDKAIWMQVRDVVRGAFDELRFNKEVAKLADIAKQPIKGDVPKVVELSANEFKLNDGERGAVLRHLIEGGDLSRYGLFNAITRTAQDIESYDRATELEAIGGRVIELPRNQWERLAEAA